MIQNRLWTADRLEERGWPHEDTCSFCDQEIETANPLFIGCFAKELWAGFASTHPTAAQAASRSTAINGWWRKIDPQIQEKQSTKKTDHCRCIWSVAPLEGKEPPIF
jgi:hypothetical protein